MQSSNIPSRRAKKKKRVWPYVVVALCFIMAALAGAMFASSSLVDEKKAAAPAAEEGLLTAKDKATIMIMGVDEREDDVGRSDTLMIASIDPKRNKAALLSVPRDTRVKIKGHGFDKINAAYAYGKERLAQDTVENFLGLNIDHYIIINTKSFKRIIDAIGGIDIDVEKRMHYEDPWDDDGGLVIDFRPGKQHMDGAKAITYVRYRDEEGDIGRIHRQQAFMKACVDKIVSPSIIPRLPMVIKEIVEAVNTDLTFRQMLEFVGTLKEAKSNGLRAEMVPGRPLYIDGISYWIADLTKLRTTVADTLGITIDAKHRARMERDAAEYENSIPANATEVPDTDNTIGRAVRDADEVDRRPTKTTRKNDTAASKKDTVDKSSSRSSSTASSASETKDTAPAEDNSSSTKVSEPVPSTVENSTPTPGGNIGKSRF